ncbi:hypothetical protein BDL97_07G001500 [Sphagnum fallax]|nr:hypothetical protein BDL97_07G001500 [Sphagnum fallax]
MSRFYRAHSSSENLGKWRSKKNKSCTITRNLQLWGGHNEHVIAHTSLL